jgi:DNA-binding transcriptional LysR family regulator
MGGADLNAVTMLLKVVELRNFRAAARALGVPKSTVSAKIAQLEDHLGVRLLERTTRTLRPTDAGNSYLRFVAPAFELLEEGEHVVNDLQAKPSGRLRLTTTVEFGQGGPYLTRALVEYARRYPAVDVEVELLDRRVDLVEEGFDLAVRAGPLSDSSLIARRLGPAHLRLYASPEYLRRRGTPRRPRDLVRHDCLVMTNHLEPETWSFRRKSGSKPESITVDVEPRIAVNSFRVLRALAIAGQGITRLPDHLGAEAVRDGTLRSLLDGHAPPPAYWHAVYPSARHQSSKVRGFIEVLEAAFAG